MLLSYAPSPFQEQGHARQSRHSLHNENVLPCSISYWFTSYDSLDVNCFSIRYLLSPFAVSGVWMRGQRVQCTCLVSSPLAFCNFHPMIREEKHKDIECLLHLPVNTLNETLPDVGKCSRQHFIIGVASWFDSTVNIAYISPTCDLKLYF